MHQLNEIISSARLRFSLLWRSLVAERDDSGANDNSAQIIQQPLATCLSVDRIWGQLHGGKWKSAHKTQISMVGYLKLSLTYRARLSCGNCVFYMYTLKMAFASGVIRKKHTNIPIEYQFLTSRMELHCAECNRMSSNPFMDAHECVQIQFSVNLPNRQIFLLRCPSPNADKVVRRTVIWSSSFGREAMSSH